MKIWHCLVGLNVNHWQKDDLSPFTTQSRERSILKTEKGENAGYM